MDVRWHHVAMAVRDMDRIVPFYRDLLGFEVDWEKPHYNGESFARVVGLEDAVARVVMLKGPGGRMELFQYLTPTGVNTRRGRQCDFGLTHVALEIKGIQAMYNRLMEAGVPFSCPPQNLRPGVWATYMQDPEGNTVELIEYK
jgi:catechol 2,3-dioxygenase-like lactoylglutathione lyase family enzyme